MKITLVIFCLFLLFKKINFIEKRKKGFKLGLLQSKASTHRYQQMIMESIFADSMRLAILIIIFIDAKSE